MSTSGRATVNHAVIAGGVVVPLGAWLWWSSGWKVAVLGVAIGFAIAFGLRTYLEGRQPSWTVRTLLLALPVVVFVGLAVLA